MQRSQGALPGARTARALANPVTVISPGSAFGDGAQTTGSSAGQGSPQPPSWSSANRSSGFTEPTAVRMEPISQRGWEGALEVMPSKAPSGGRVLRAPGDEQTAVPLRPELSAMEERITRQVLRMQDQSERFIEILVQPIQAKVAAMAERISSYDAQISELRGSIRGVEENVEAQVRHSDAAEARLRRWRKMLEDGLQTQQADIKNDLAGVLDSALPPADTASRTDLENVVGALKEEVKQLVAEALEQRGGGEVCATQQQLDEFARSLRQEFQSFAQHLEGLATKPAPEPAQQELALAADSLRKEVHFLNEQELTLAADSLRRDVQSLTEKVMQCERFFSSQVGMQGLEDRAQRVEQAVEGLRQEQRRLQEERQALRLQEEANKLDKQAFAELTEKHARAEHSMDAFRREMGRLQEEVTALRMREVRPDATTRFEVEQMVHRVAEQLLEERSSSSGFAELSGLVDRLAGEVTLLRARQRDVLAAGAPQARGAASPSSSPSPPPQRAAASPREAAGATSGEVLVSPAPQLSRAARLADDLAAHLRSARRAAAEEAEEAAAQLDLSADSVAAHLVQGLRDELQGQVDKIWRAVSRRGGAAVRGGPGGLEEEEERAAEEEESEAAYDDDDDGGPAVGQDSVASALQDAAVAVAECQLALQQVTRAVAELQLRMARCEDDVGVLMRRPGEHHDGDKGGVGV